MDYSDRPEGSTSKLNTYSDGFRVLLTIRRLFSTYRPLQYFGVIAAVLVILAAAFFLSILITYFKTGLVPNFPTLIVCGFAVIAAIQSFFAGLILSNIHQKNLREFEIELYKAESEFRKNTRT